MSISQLDVKLWEEIWRPLLALLLFPASIAFVYVWAFVVAGWVGIIPLSMSAVKGELSILVPMLYAVGWLGFSAVFFGIGAIWDLRS